jgi:hypothetical protein
MNQPLRENGAVLFSNWTQRLLTLEIVTFITIIHAEKCVY